MLKKDKWYKKDESELKAYLNTLSNPNKIEWTKNILNTNLKALAISSPKLRRIAKEIIKGDYFSFLEQNFNFCYEVVAINGYILSKIKDFDTYKFYLEKYSKNVDCWANCDLLSFPIKNQEENFFNLAEQYINSNKTFKRRIGIIILFSFTNNEKYSSKVFKIINTLYNEKEYYVNMAVAWLLCEMFIKQRDKTIEFLSYANLNSFTANKFVQKCRDSFRVSLEDKQYLLLFKK